MRRKGFTLIELLVVIAIIALLVSILLPSLAQAKEHAKAVLCQTNMKNLGQAFATYGTDNNDVIFSGWDNGWDYGLGFPAGNGWHRQWPYIAAYWAKGASLSRDSLYYRNGSGGGFYQPVDTPNHAAHTWGHPHPYLYWGAGWDWSRGIVPELHCPSMLDQQYAYFNNVGSYTMNTRTGSFAPAEILASGGRLPWGPWGWGDYIELNRQTHVQDTVMIGGPRAKNPWFDYVAPANRPPGGVMEDPHMGGSNYAFVDGHVERRAYDEFIEWNFRGEVE